MEKYTSGRKKKLSSPNNPSKPKQTLLSAFFSNPKDDSQGKNQKRKRKTVPGKKDRRVSSENMKKRRTKPLVDEETQKVQVSPKGIVSQFGFDPGSAASSPMKKPSRRSKRSTTLAPSPGSPGLVHPANVQEQTVPVGPETIELGTFVSDPKRHKRFSARFAAGAQSPTRQQKAKRKSTKTTKYTPLEEQFLSIKNDHQDVILFVECGYKYRFFGEDAEIASKELNIGCFLAKNMMSASIPTERLGVHVRRLVHAGHKVGVVSQTETQAIRDAEKQTGKKKGKTFGRALTAMYTKSTLIGEDINPLDAPLEPGQAASSANFLMCIWESPEKQYFERGVVPLSIVAVSLVTGDIVYDQFDDDRSRTELVMRLEHLRPCEVLLGEGVAPVTKKIINKLRQGPEGVRVEHYRSSQWNYDEAYSRVTQFYAQPKSNQSSEDCEELDEFGDAEPRELQRPFEVLIPSQSGLQSSFEWDEQGGAASAEHIDLLRLPESVLVCLGVTIDYLERFLLHRVLHLTNNIRHFSSSAHMSLSGNAMHDLEIVANQENGGVENTLLWLTDHTSTMFGARMLRKWLQQPLLTRRAIVARQDAVEELICTTSSLVLSVVDIMPTFPDLEKGLTRCHFRKCSPREFLALLNAFSSVCEAVAGFSGYSDTLLRSEIQSDLLQKLFSPDGLPDMRSDLNYFRGGIVSEPDASGSKMDLFIEATGRFPQIAKHQQNIREVEQELQSILRDIRKRLRMPSLQYRSVNQTEYLIELTRAKAKHIPTDWVQISTTKSLARYHTPEIIEALMKLALHRDRLKIAADKAWDKYLAEFSEKYTSFRRIVDTLATLDCLNSLATMVNSREGFVKPEIVEEQQLVIEEGRHPVAEALDAANDFVPNSINMPARRASSTQGGECASRCMILTGPNMGGKTSYIKMVAVIIVLAQIGSYVPASFVRLAPFDGIFTRMGASDNLAQRQSTFFTELMEASAVLKRATSRSLVVLDELGRGTSTHDGVAIAYATLDHMIKRTQCFTLFVTHYPILAQLEAEHPGTVTNCHMSFLELPPEEAEDAESRIVFLYKLVEGAAHNSYGLNVARLAHLPKSVIMEAEEKSKQFQSILNGKRTQAAYEKLQAITAALLETEDEGGKAVHLQSLKKLQENVKELLVAGPEGSVASAE